MPGASGRLETTQTISAMFARWMASKFEPRPDKRTARRMPVGARSSAPAAPGCRARCCAPLLDPRRESRGRHVVRDLPAPLHHVSDEEELLADLREVLRDGVDLLRRDDHHQDRKSTRLN